MKRCFRRYGQVALGGLMVLGLGLGANHLRAQNLLAGQDFRLTLNQFDASKFEGRTAHVFIVKKGDGTATISGFAPEKGDKLRLQGFGLTSLKAVQPLMRQDQDDVVIALPGGPQVRLLKVSLAGLSRDAFQLELDRSGLSQTFDDEFDSFSWYAEGLSPQEDGKGTWRTHYGWGPATAQASRTLQGNLQVYIDPAFVGTGSKAFGLTPFHVQDGKLEIWAERAPDAILNAIWGRKYTSGLITNKLRFSQLYGVFETRARMPKGKGFWPAFWLLPSDSSWPPEIDIFEVLSRDPKTLFMTVHSKASGPHTSEGVEVSVPDLTEAYHDFALDWQKDKIRWYFDGIEVASLPTSADMHKPMYILANLAVGGDWPGDPDATTPFPGVFSIDWIRAYRRDEAGHEPK